LLSHENTKSAEGKGEKETPLCEEEGFRARGSEAIMRAHNDADHTTIATVSVLFLYIVSFSHTAKKGEGLGINFFPKVCL
jgi:hypothetical protein